jgi:hypothetical protein
MPSKPHRTNGAAKIAGRVERNKSVVAQVETEQVAGLHEDGGGSVEVSAGYTENLGEMNFLKLQVSVRRPCAPTLESEQAAAEGAFATVDSLLDEYRGRLLADRHQS